MSSVKLCRNTLRQILLPLTWQLGLLQSRCPQGTSGVCGGVILCAIGHRLSHSHINSLGIFFFRMGIPPHSIPDIAQLRQKTRVLVNPNPRTSSSEGVKISSVAETLPSHRSVSSTAFVQDDRRAATKREISTGALSLVKPTTKLSRLGMDRWIEKSEEDPSSVRAGSKQDGIVDLLAKPLALVSPFLIAVAGTFLFC